MQTEPSQRIHKNATKAWTVNALIVGLVWFIPLVFFVVLSIGGTVNTEVKWYQGIDWFVFSLLLIGGLFMYLLIGLIYPKLRWQRWKYDVSEKEIDLLRGIIIKKRTLVPINRVQHVDTRQGPVYRKFGLSSVTISTAATTHEIPALDDETANELRNTISTLVRKVKGDV
ncbi:PH domain-containing protein [Gracilimonas amylolytica]|uniref:PH domain-containing protein n=1 Tax=Gracilimonas amylolytica TaxID=1749045 RepID=UPI000CD83078|nr:PH domain-containing protein [Gracilimonas amylolytica]